MSGVTGHEALQGYLSDRIVDGREARAIVNAYPDSAQLADALTTLGVDEAAGLAERIRQTASAEPFRFVDVAPGGGPDLSHEVIAVIHSPDLDNEPLPGAHWDAEVRPSSWREVEAFLSRLKATLDERRQTDPQAHLTLVLNVHGNNGTGLKLVTNRDERAADGHTRREISQSVASAAWFNEALLRAGFAPSDVTVISEACNAGRVHAVSADGFSPAEMQRLQAQATRLGHFDARYWLYVDGERAKGFNPGRSASDSYTVRPAEVLDARPSEAAAGFTWLGYVNGVNTSVTTMHRLAGQQTTPTYEETPSMQVERVTGEAVIGVLNRVPSNVAVRGDVITVNGAEIAALRQRIIANGAGFYTAAERTVTR